MKLGRAPNGKGTITRNGYRILERGGRKIYEHVAIAEKALGKPLPLKAVVHHVNKNGLDNRNTNLVVCPDQSYHLLIHRRMRELGL
jgi:hypothetical protein